MNHIYRLVWSSTKNMLVAVAEIAGSRRKGSTARIGNCPSMLTRVLQCLALLLAPGAALALPSGGQVVAGQATLSQSGHTLTVSQGSDRAILNWQSFGIGGDETVNFNQPDAGSVALNRVLGNDASAIYGHLNANGQVFLVNPNGVFFAPGAQVDVGGIVASTLGLEDQDFLSGHYHFSGAPGAGVVNDGRIAAAQGGYVAFIGPHVVNDGAIATPGGTTALGAGSSVDLTLADDTLLSFEVSGSALQAQAENGGVIAANGGSVILSAEAQGALLQTAVNNTGLVQAQTVANRSGRIVLLGGDAGTVNVAGTLDASAPAGGAGGYIETSGGRVQIADSAAITTKSASGDDGQWLIDPQDFNIARTGDITGPALSTALASGNVTIQTTADVPTCAGIDCSAAAINFNDGSNGDINVEDAVTWSKNTLTLNAYRNINIDAEMNGSGTAGLALLYGQGAGDGSIGGVASTYKVIAPVNLASTGSFSTQLGSAGAVNTYTIITSLGSPGSTTGTDLQGINTADRFGGLSGNFVLGADIDATPTAGWNQGAGFAPIGQFGGGQTANFKSVFDGLGHQIIGLHINQPSGSGVGLFFGNTGAIRNVGIAGGSIVGQSSVGALAGGNSGVIEDAYATGAVKGDSTVGGLAGANSGTITASYASDNVTGDSNSNFIGGLVGINRGSIDSSYATGSVSGDTAVGGLAGAAQNGSISNAYATGAVTGTDEVGGLLGFDTSATVADVYTTGSVSGGASVGALVGVIEFTSITDGYWNSSNTALPAFGDATNASGSSTVRGLTTAQMHTAPNFAGFNFTSTPGGPGWVIIDITGTVNNGGGAGGTLPMLASEYRRMIVNAHQLQLVAMAPTVSYTQGANIDATTTAGQAGDVWQGGSFVPIGIGTAFAGTFEGAGYTVNHLTVDEPGRDLVGLFSATAVGAELRNVHLVDATVTGADFVGGLVGQNSGGISYSSVVGSITESGAGTRGYVGGLVGDNNQAQGGDGNPNAIHDVYAAGTVTGSDSVGGLVGSSEYSGIGNAYAINTVTATGRNPRVGALVGAAQSAGPPGINNSFYDKTVNPSLAGVGLETASGTVNPADVPGGFVGMSTADMKTQANFTSATAANGNHDPGWDFNNVWAMLSGGSYPLLLTVPAGYTPVAGGGSGGTTGGTGGTTGGTGGTTGGTGGTTGGTGGTAGGSGGTTGGTGGTTGGTGTAGGGGSSPAGNPPRSAAAEAALQAQQQAILNYHAPVLAPPSADFGGGLIQVTDGGVNGSSGQATAPPISIDQLYDQVGQQVASHHIVTASGPVVRHYTSAPSQGGGNPVLNFLGQVGGTLMSGLGNLAHGVSSLLGQAGNAVSGALGALGNAASHAGAALRQDLSNLQPVRVGNEVITFGEFKSVQAAVIAAGGGNLRDISAAVIAAGGGNLRMSDVAQVIAAGGGNAVPGPIARVIAAGGGNLNATAVSGLMNLSNGSFNPKALAGVIAAGGGNLTLAQASGVIAAGGGNLQLSPTLMAGVIAAGGGNVIAAGGGNVIAAGGGNVIAAGAGNFITLGNLNGVIAAGGGNLAPLQMTSLMSSVRAGVIAAGGGNVIAAGGGNLFNIAAGVIAAGGGNLGAAQISALSSHLVSIGAGSLTVAAMTQTAAEFINTNGSGVIAAGGGNVIAAGGGNVIAAGGGNVIAAGSGN